MTFIEFKQRALQRQASQRIGQHAMNTLGLHRKDIYDKIMAKKDISDFAFDPFYNDKNLPNFWTFVEKNW